MSLLMKLKQYTREDILNKINTVKSFIVCDDEVDGKFFDEIAAIIRNKIVEIEGTVKFTVVDIGFYRCADKFADIVVYKLLGDVPHER